MRPDAPAPPSIGIVLHDFALGGTERIAVRLATRWAAEGAAVTIFCGAGKGAMRALVGGGVRVVEAVPPIARGPGSLRALRRAAARHFAAEPVALAFVPGNFHWPVAPALARLPRDVRPAVVAQVSAALSKPQRPPLKQWAFDRRMRWLLRSASAIVTLSEPAAREARIMVPGVEVVTIPLPALGDEVRPALAPPPDAPLVLAVGRLVPEKGFDLLIHAFAQMTGQHSAELAILGEGPDRARLEGLIAARGLAKRVTLPGYVEDTRAWLDRARLCVLPSRFEGYPAVLVEAFAAGRAVVATACTPAVAELIDDPAIGRVVPIDDAAVMAQAMTAMLNQPPPDPARLVARVERHRIGTVARDYLALFARVAR